MIRKTSSAELSKKALEIISQISTLQESIASTKAYYEIGNVDVFIDVLKNVLTVTVSIVIGLLTLFPDRTSNIQTSIYAIVIECIILVIFLLKRSAKVAWYRDEIVKNKNVVLGMLSSERRVVVAEITAKLDEVESLVRKGYKHIKPNDKLYDFYSEAVKIFDKRNK